MKKKIIILMLSAVVLAEIICIAGFCLYKGQEEGESRVEIREIRSQTVLYTIYRGQYLKISDAVNELYALAEEKGMQPDEPVITCCLNSPLCVTNDHRLIEIQIPVDSSAMILSGTLGSMTDVKVIPPMKVAVAIKPEGKENPTDVLDSLFTWINQNGYIVKGRMQQVVKRGCGDYQKLRTEFIIPVDKYSKGDKPTILLDPCYM